MVWMLTLSVNLFGTFLTSSGYFMKNPQLFGYDTTLVLLHGPFSFLYVTYYINQRKTLRREEFYHFIPYLFYTSYFVYQVRVNDTDYEAIKALIYTPDFIVLSMQISIHFILLVYLLLILLRLGKRNGELEEVYSFKEGVNLQWIRNMLWPLIGIAGIIVISTLFSDLFTLMTQELKARVFYGCLSVLPFYLLFQAIRHDIFRMGSRVSFAKEKYTGSTLSKNESLVIAFRLDQLMEQEKPYLDSYLSIAKLADMLDTHPKHLSQVINEQRQTNFFNYINKYRVREVQERLNNKAYQHFTILSIALDAGFNTKSAFNSSFKKMTGLTPSEYKQRLHSK